MTPLETLKAARQLISDPAKWTQGAQSRDKLGHPYAFDTDKAVCWCALGAIERVAGRYSSERFEASTKLRSISPKGLVIDFNDTHTHAEVLALFDAAIAELEGAAT
jgi:hypothetical protein